MAEQARLWTPGSDVPVWMLQTAQEVNDKYPNLNLAWIPPEFRGPEDDRPFAITEIDSDGNTVGIVARFSQLEFHPANIFNWLYDHDSHNVDVWANYMLELAKEKADREYAAQQKQGDLIDKLGSIIKSPLHTYRINGHKVGAENNYPTIGLYDASGEDQ